MACLGWRPAGAVRGWPCGHQRDAGRRPPNLRDGQRAAVLPPVPTAASSAEPHGARVPGGESGTSPGTSPCPEVSGWGDRAHDGPGGGVQVPGGLGGRRHRSLGTATQERVELEVQGLLPQRRLLKLRGAGESAGSPASPTDGLERAGPGEVTAHCETLPRRDRAPHSAVWAPGQDCAGTGGQRRRGCRPGALEGPGRPRCRQA